MSEGELTPELLREWFNPRRLDEQPATPPEPEVEGLPPKDKLISEYTEAEWAAVHQNRDRTFREAGKQERREQEEAEQRIQAEAARTDEQRGADALIEALNPATKRAAEAALVRSMFGSDEGDLDG